MEEGELPEVILIESDDESEQKLDLPNHPSKVALNKKTNGVDSNSPIPQLWAAEHEENGHLSYPSFPSFSNSTEKELAHHQIEREYFPDSPSYVPQVPLHSKKSKSGSKAGSLFKSKMENYKNNMVRKTSKRGGRNRKKSKGFKWKMDSKGRYRKIRSNSVSENGRNSFQTPSNGSLTQSPRSKGICIAVDDDVNDARSTTKVEQRERNASDFASMHEHGRPVYKRPNGIRGSDRFDIDNNVEVVSDIRRIEEVPPNGVYRQPIDSHSFSTSSASLMPYGIMTEDQMNNRFEELKRRFEKQLDVLEDENDQLGARAFNDDDEAADQGLGSRSSEDLEHAEQLEVEDMLRDKQDEDNVSGAPMVENAVMDLGTADKVHVRDEGKENGGRRSTVDLAELRAAAIRGLKRKQVDDGVTEAAKSQELQYNLVCDIATSSDDESSSEESEKDGEKRKNIGELETEEKYSKIGENNIVGLEKKSTRERNSSPRLSIAERRRRDFLAIKKREAALREHLAVLKVSKFSPFTAKGSPELSRSTSLGHAEATDGDQESDVGNSEGTSEEKKHTDIENRAEVDRQGVAKEETEMIARKLGRELREKEKELLLKRMQALSDSKRKRVVADALSVVHPEVQVLERKSATIGFQASTEPFGGSTRHFDVNNSDRGRDEEGTVGGLHPKSHLRSSGEDLRKEKVRDHFCAFSGTWQFASDSESEFTPGFKCADGRAVDFGLVQFHLYSVADRKALAADTKYRRGASVFSAC